MSQIADHILHLSGWVALGVIFLIPALESSVFLGFVFPGEIAVLLGGVLAYQHRVSLPAAMAAAIAGAIAGDSIGYEVGKRWGRTLLYGTVGRLVKHHHLERAERYLAERGGKAVFVGRFTAALRVLIPGLAGMSGMPYRTFAGYNIAGGSLWAGGFVLAGYAAGNGYRRVEHVAKQASLVLLLVVVLVAAAAYGARQAIRHREGIEEFGRRQRDRPRVVRVRARAAEIAGRFRPSGRVGVGLGVVIALVTLSLAGSAFGWVVVRLLSSGRPFVIDQPVLDFFLRHRTPGFTDAVRVVTTLGGAGFFIPATIGVGALIRWRERTWRPMLLLGCAYAGAALLQRVIKDLIARPRPPARMAVVYYGGWSFPSGHATQAAAWWGALALVVAMLTPSWRHRVLAWTVAMVVTVLVGLTRCYLGAHWASDVAGGWVLGWAWLGVLGAVSWAAAGEGRRAPAGVPTSGTAVEPAGVPTSGTSVEPAPRAR